MHGCSKADERQEEHNQLPLVENVPTDGWTTQAQVERWLVGSLNHGSSKLETLEGECTTGIVYHATWQHRTPEATATRVVRYRRQSVCIDGVTRGICGRLYIIVWKTKKEYQILTTIQLLPVALELAYEVVECISEQSRTSTRHLGGML